MSSDSSSELKFDIGHVLFIDIVGYSKLLLAEQSDQIQTLREIVRGTEQFKKADAEGKLLRLPTGDGGALVFRNSLEAPVLCALEISKALKSHPELKVRMGIHSGPVNEITDLNEQANIAGVGINMAQRVMDCGDAGHILLSKRVADDLEQYPQWRSHLSDLGECEVKHGTRVSIVNLYTDDAGNRAAPQKFRTVEAGPSRTGTVPAAGHRTKGKRFVAASAIVIALIVVAAFWFLSRQRGGPHSSVSTTPSTSIAAQIPEKSIAVLPFDNLSRDPDNAYFAEGIQDEILTRLAKIAALKVISRSSTQKYKSSPDNLREVGQQLGVANLLEGSVQKIANAVHINVQLIRAATDDHLWAESYNRKLDDVFGVEGEVAAAIAEQLKAKLTGAEEQAVTEKPTQNAAAYDAYLRGVAIERNAYNTPAFEQAMLAYNRAVELDPKFALAWARIAVLRSFLFFNGLDLKTNSAAAVKDDVDKLLALSPDAGESWVAQGAYRYRVLRDFKGAVEAYEKARQKLPNNSFLLQNLAFVLRRLSRWEDSERAFQSAVEIDPRDVSLLTNIGSQFYNYLRRFDDALRVFDRALEISPDSGAAHVGKAAVLQDLGRIDEARQELARVSSAEVLDDLALGVSIRQCMYERQFDAAAALMQRRLGALSAAEVPDTLVCSAVVNGGLCEDWSGHREDAGQAFLRVIQWIKPTPETVVPPDGDGRPSILALAYAGLGDKNAALQQATRAVSEYDNDAVAKPAAEAVLAQIQAKFGDVESAIAAIPHLLKVPAGINVADLRFSPLWDPLRGDPRFEKLCQGKQQ
jgi:TolB-like protein/class 3 adenylate cyclase/Tfp pilus assembly protein PilF